MAYANRPSQNRLHAPPAGGVGEQLAQQAVVLAGQGQWTRAAQVNRDLLKNYPKDTKTLNRLGKCMTELGDYEAAIVAYRQTLECDEQNDIARKNLDRLSLLEKNVAGPAPEPTAVLREAFITDAGRSTVAALHGPADPEALAASSPGRELELRSERDGLSVCTRDGRSLGRLETHLARRLLTLLQGGNVYTATLASVSSGGVRVVLRETYRHPSQANTVSFVVPEESPAGQARLRDTLLRPLSDEDDDEEEADASGGTRAPDADDSEAETSDGEERDPYAAESRSVSDNT
ncbi:MAG: tetratricopeptide repeat protein [Chloroflexota bacterium]